jgi:hypothetical protein
MPNAIHDPGDWDPAIVIFRGFRFLHITSYESGDAPDTIGERPHGNGSDRGHVDPVRNGAQARHRRVDMPVSKLKIEIARLLKENHYIHDYKVLDDGKHGVLRLT